MERSEEFVTWKAFVSTIIGIFVLFASFFGYVLQSHVNQPHAAAVSVTEYERDQRRLTEQLRLLQQLEQDRYNEMRTRLDRISQQIDRLHAP